jgi:integrase
LPVVLTVDEGWTVIDHIPVLARLVAMLLFGPGLRLLEALRLRVTGIEFEGGQFTVRDTKWNHDRVTMLPPIGRAGDDRSKTSRSR